jgi:hypothetical protein
MVIIARLQFLRSPMPGALISVAVREGQSVSACRLSNGRTVIENDTHYQGVVSCGSLNDALSYQVLHARPRPSCGPASFTISSIMAQSGSVALAQNCCVWDIFSIPCILMLMLQIVQHPFLY